MNFFILFSVLNAARLALAFLNPKSVKATQKIAFSGAVKISAARPRLHPIQNPYPKSQVEKEQTSTSWLHDTRRLEGLAPSSINADRLQILHICTTTLAVPDFQSWAEFVPITRSYDRNNFLPVVLSKIMKNVEIFILFLPLTQKNCPSGFLCSPGG